MSSYHSSTAHRDWSHRLTVLIYDEYRFDSEIKFLRNRSIPARIRVESTVPGTSSAWEAEVLPLNCTR